MLSQEAESLWQEYLANEQIGVRSVMLDSLDRFISVVESEPLHKWADWALSLCRRVVDEGEDIPVRFPLFRRVLERALLAGYQKSQPGCARWLAGFEQLLYKSPASQQQLGAENITRHFLLRVALIHDPTDVLARNKLIQTIAYGFDYSLHEVPWGVLYSYNGATIEQCGELLDELSEFRQLVDAANLRDRYAEAIELYQTHFSGYQDYLKRRPEFASYEAYLIQHNIDY